MGSVNLNSQRPLFLASLILGIIPCDRNLKSSKFRLFYSVTVNLLVFGWMLYLKMSNDTWDSKQFKNNCIVEIMVTIRESTHLLFIGAHVCSLLFRRNTLEKVLKGVKLLELPASPGNTSEKIFYVVFIICNAVLLSAASKLCPSLYFHSQINKMEMEWPYMMSFFLGVSFSALVEYLRSHLDQMTEYLEPNEKTLSLQINLTLYILDLSRSLNKFYSMQIFVLCCRVLINLILSVYFIVDSMTKNPSFLFPSTDIDLVSCFVYIALVSGFAQELSVLFSICSSCTNFETSADRFNDRLFSLMRDNSDLCNNDKLYLYIRMKQEAHFTACGFYSLGYPLITSITATATTYIVILIQFMSAD